LILGDEDGASDAAVLGIFDAIARAAAAALAALDRGDRNTYARIFEPDRGIVAAHLSRALTRSTRRAWCSWRT